MDENATAQNIKKWHFFMFMFVMFILGVRNLESRWETFRQYFGVGDWVVDVIRINVTFSMKAN